MEINRVMTIESVDDSITRKMLKLIYGSSEFKDYIINHCFYVKEQSSINSNQLYQILKKDIEKFKPEVILIHTGAYFYNNINAFTETLPNIKNEFPQIIIGIQNRDKQDKEIIDLLDQNYKTLTLERKFFETER